MTNRCATCRWWNVHNPTYDFNPCHRYPPTPMQYIGAKRDPYGERMEVTISPTHPEHVITGKDDYCGEYSPKEHQ